MDATDIIIIIYLVSGIVRGLHGSGGAVFKSP